MSGIFDSMRRSFSGGDDVEQAEEDTDTKNMFSGDVSPCFLVQCLLERASSSMGGVVVSSRDLGGGRGCLEEGQHGRVHSVSVNESHDRVSQCFVRAMFVYVLTCHRSLTVV